MSSPYQAIKHNTLADDIVEQIEKLVLNRELHVGDPLPSERELAHELQVSRQALREAMRILAQKGLVQVSPGRGAFVAQPSASFLGDSLYTYLRLNPHLVRDFLEVRSILETEAAAIAAERACPEHLAAMKAALDDLGARRADLAHWIDAGVASHPEAARAEDVEAHRSSLGRWSDADLAFHTELARATGNQAIFLMTLSLRGALRESILYFSSQPHIISASVDLHRNVYEAVAGKQVEAARRAMREHFRITLDEVRRSSAPQGTVQDEGSGPIPGA